jgi:two-component system invasion response regulator UvrY
MLEATRDIRVIAEADSGEQAYALQPEHAPDVVVMDLAMAGMGGIEAIRRLTARDPGVRILALSGHEDASHPRRALNAGAQGYLSKRTAPETLIVAIRQIASGERFIDASVAQKLAVDGSQQDPGPIARLSEREFAVFLQLAQGASVNAIALTLHLSPSTVGTHLYHIKSKLDVSNQAEMTLLAIRHGLIQP